MVSATSPTPLFDDLVAFERGELTFDETVRLFQRLLDTGLIHALQPYYARTAVALIDGGHCVVDRPFVEAA